jgi:hypothetical protein
MLVTKFYQIMEERRRRRALVNIRREFEKAGYPLDHFRDSQIEAALTRWTDDIVAVTLNAKTIYRVVKRLRRVARGERKSESSREVLVLER